jgi:hypothetical protein
MKTLRRVLVILGITQKIKDERGFERYRLNPYNPLSYITLLLALIIMGMYGFISAVVEILEDNPFRYQ